MLQHNNNMTNITEFNLTILTTSDFFDTLPYILNKILNLFTYVHFTK